MMINGTYTGAYSPYEAVLIIDGYTFYTKTRVTCDDDLEDQIFVQLGELKMRVIGYCSILEEDDMHVGK